MTDLHNAPAIILVRPQMGENIGAAARAMCNFGLKDLRIVAPRDGWPSLEAERNAAGALDIMPPAQLFDTLQDAVADLHYTFATTARRRDIVKEVFTPESSAQDIERKSGDGEKTGLVFGAERTGLTNDEISLCQALINIPTNPDFSSLNLAQSVLLLAHECRKALHHEDRSDPPKTNNSPPATQDKLEEFFIRLESNLDTAGFFKSQDLKPTMARNIRAMLTRTALTDQELRTFHGILSALTKGRA